MRSSLPAEVLLATGVAQDRDDGTSGRRADKAQDMLDAIDAGSTWVELLSASLVAVCAQEDQRALRTALVAHAGRTLAWINDIDQRRNEAA